MRIYHLRQYQQVGKLFHQTLNITNTCLIACLVISFHGSSTLTHPSNSHAAFPLPHSRGHRQIWSFDKGSSILAVTTQSTLITALIEYAISTHSLTLQVQLWVTLKYYCVYTGLMAGDKANFQMKLPGVE